MLRVVHGPFVAIEDSLFEALKDREKFEQTMVVAPSARLVRHLKVSAADRFAEGLFGVHFLHLYHLAAEMAEYDRTLVRDAIFFERLITRLLREHYREAPYLGKGDPTYDLAASLLGAIRDIKDAGAEPDPGAVVAHIEQLIEEERTTLNQFDILKLNDVMCLYRHYEEALRAQEVMDASDLFITAARGDAPFEKIYVYGFYDMTQIQWNLVRALAEKAEVTVLSPYEEGRMQFAERFIKSYAIAAADETVAVTAPAAQPERTVFNTAGEADEVWGVAKEILQLGVPFSEIGVVARTMEPYLPHIESIFAENEIRWIPPRGRAMADDPKIKYVRALYRVGLDDYPRGATLDVLCSPFFDGPKDRSFWGAITAVRRISRGREQWRRRLDVQELSFKREEESLEIPPEVIRELREAFDRLCAVDVPERATWAEFARAYREAPGEVTARLAGVSDEIVSHAEFQEAFERELDRLEAPAERTGGVTVCDVMGARGLRFKVLFVLGLNSHSFPRFILEEPFITDRARHDVFELRGHKISIRHEGYDEERLLFQLMEQAATEKLYLFHQRSDAEGRLRDRSPFVSERGTPISRSLREKLRRLKPELMTRREVLLHAEFEGADVEACLKSFGRDFRRYRQATGVIALLQSQALTAHEGLIGPIPAPERTSPTKIETYTNCPFKYFAANVLRLFHLDDPEEAEDLTPMEIGTLQHKILEIHYRKGMPIVEAADLAFAQFEVPPLYPALREAHKRVMVEALQEFVAWERGQMGEWTPAGFEEWGEVDLAGLHFVGRIDRVDRIGDRKRVVDYKRKMGATFKTKLATLASDARRVQAPLYLAMTGAEEVQFRFVEEPWRGAPEKDFVRSLSRADVPENFEETLSGIADKMRRGEFQIKPNTYCSNCDYRTMCRKNYLPTRRKL